MSAPSFFWLPISWENCGKERLDVSESQTLVCKSAQLTVWELAYSPRLVAEIVDGVQRVDGGDAGVLQPNDQVAEVFVLGHAVGVLADQDKVGPERPARRRRERERNPDVNISEASMTGGTFPVYVWFRPSCHRLTCSYNQVQLCFSPVTYINPHALFNLVQYWFCKAFKLPVKIWFLVHPDWNQMVHKSHLIRLLLNRLKSLAGHNFTLGQIPSVTLFHTTQSPMHC